MIKLIKFQRWNIKGVITDFREGQIISEDSIPERTLSDMLRLGYAEIVNEEVKEAEKEISEPKIADKVKNKMVKNNDISNKKLGKKRGRPKKNKRSK